MKNKSNNKSKNKRETKSKKISNNNNNDNMNNQCDNMGDQRINNENMDKQNVNIQNEGNGFNNNKNNNDLLNVYISPNMINHSLSSTCEKKNKEDNKMNDNKFLNSSSKMKIPEISTNNSNEKIVNVSNDEMLVYHNLTVLNVKEQGGVTEESSCIKRTYFVDQFYDSYNMRNEKITDDNMQVEDIYNVKENIKRTLKGDGHDDVKTNMLSEDNSYASGLWGNEINFISNNENCLNSYDISCDEKYIPNEEEQDEELCSNNILVKDIEEKKMCGKLFFEEICVFRINEKNEHGHENLRKNNHNDDTHKMYSSYENIQNINKQSTNPFCKKDEMEKSQGTNLFYDNYINSVDITKLELNKNCYQHINYEVQNLIKKENSYAAEMNVGLVFRKYIPILINLSCNYLLIKKNEKNVITCISYTNIIDVKIVKKNKRTSRLLYNTK
ncbi:hypothetical protein PFTANZ_06657 [Plasmodium falciparum Tanzania (2000708)]|uniref:Uncharacterized protein n=1 Tax=Plasmodium falciparum Tanzania (2000708) TaxID=1036725 RepID=A0A024VWC2_PLAFA|nr:hypothetical protein PFTANZ_06657 [Plasmodium falciparum Tanzania (2000708)]